MTNDNEQGPERIANDLKRVLRIIDASAARAAAEAWQRDNDLAIAQAAEIERLKVERAMLVAVLRSITDDAPAQLDPHTDCISLMVSRHDLVLARAALAKAGGAQ